MKCALLWMQPVAPLILALHFLSFPWRVVSPPLCPSKHPQEHTMCRSVPGSLGGVTHRQGHQKGLQWESSAKGEARLCVLKPLLLSARPQGTCPQGLPSPTFEVPEDHCVGTQPGQYLDRGAGRVTLSLSSAPWRFVGRTDAGQQWLHSTELNLDASLGLENPPKAEGDAVGGSGDPTHEIRAHGHPDATAVLRQRMMGRKPRFRQWKMACRFPGAQA